MLASTCSSLLKIENGQQLEATGRPGNQYSVVNQLSFGFAPVLAIKPLDATRRIDELLLTRKERMTVRTNLKANLRLCRASLPRLAARAMHRSVHVFWMNIRLHGMLLSGIFLLSQHLRLTD
jgi:hypothetical protein